MNVEKLHHILSMIKCDFDQHKIISQFSDFTWKMSQYVEDPSDENSNTFKLTLDALNSSLEAFKSNRLVPTDHGIVLQLNAAHIIGRGLRQSIEDILSTHATVKTNVAQKLTDLLAEVNQFYERSADIIRGLCHFNIESENLDIDEFELGFIYPAKQFNFNLAKLKNEIIFINKLISDIYETTGEQRPEIDLRSLSSGDVSIYLRSSATIADKTMHLIEGIVNVYDTIGDIQQKSKELKLLEVSQNIIDLLKEEEKQRITTGLEKLKSNLFDSETSDKLDDGRMNELENSISIDLKQLAQKIERGLKIEVSVANQTLDESEVIDGVNIQQLADLGKLMTSSAFTHEPVLLFADEKTPSTKPTIDEQQIGEPKNETTSAKKKKAKPKKKKTEPDIEEEFLIDTNTDVDDDGVAEFDWVITDD